MERKSNQIFDELLIIRCQYNDKEAMGLLWKRWQPKMLKWSFDLTRDQEQALEVAQESWISIFKGIHKLRDPAFFRHWAYRIVQRRAADLIRNLQRERSMQEELSHTTSHDTTESLEGEDQVGHMLSAIRTLPESQQQLLRLFYQEKMSVKAIANILKLKEGTVKSRLHYIRKELKDQLKNRNHE